MLNLKTGNKQIITVKGHVQSLAFSHNGKYLAVGSTHNYARI